MANLLEYNVIVGATERMSDSLLLLRTLIDENGEATELFEEFGMTPEDDRSKENVKQKSRPRLKEGMMARAERIEAEPVDGNELPPGWILLHWNQHAIVRFLCYPRLF